MRQAERRYITGAGAFYIRHRGYATFANLPAMGFEEALRTFIEADGDLRPGSKVVDDLLHKPSLFPKLMREIVSVNTLTREEIISLRISVFHNHGDGLEHLTPPEDSDTAARLGFLPHRPRPEPFGVRWDVKGSVVPGGGSRDDLVGSDHQGLWSRLHPAALPWAFPRIAAPLTYHRLACPGHEIDVTAMCTMDHCEIQAHRVLRDASRRAGEMT